MRWRGLLILVLLIVAGSLAARSAHGQTGATRFVELEEFADTPWKQVPDRFRLQGTLFDDAGQPVEGAEVHAEVAGLRATTDAKGHFEFLDIVTPDDRIAFSHPEHVTVSREARALYAGEDGEAFIWTAKYRESFDIGPQGGLYRGETLILEVPEGAVFNPLTVRAAVLPLDMALDGGGDLQNQRLAAIRLEPAGLSFRRPIRILLPLSLQGAGPRELEVLTIDPETGFYVNDETSTVETDGENAVLEISQLGQFVLGDPTEAVTLRRLKRTFDVNGDDNLTTEDAELVAILSGGAHSATWRQSAGAGTAVMAMPRNGGLQGGKPVAPDEAQAILERLGLAGAARTAETLEFNIEVAEGRTKCIYFLRWFDYWRAQTWRQHIAKEQELEGIIRAYRTARRGEDGWAYFGISGAGAVSLERSLFDGDRIAVQKAGESYKIYRLDGDYVVREPVGAARKNCGVGNLRARAEAGPIEDFGFFGAGERLDQAAFTAVDDGYRSVRYGGWGTLPGRAPALYKGMECTVDAVGQTGIATGIEHLGRQTTSRISSLDKAVTASLSADLPSAGLSGSGAFVGGAAETRLAARNHVRMFLNQVRSDVGFTIHNAHARHYSDHALFKLDLLITTRIWRRVQPDQVPRGLRARLVGGVRWSRGRAFARAGDALYMTLQEGGWFASSDPVTSKKEIGFLLLRYNQDDCTSGLPVTVSFPPGEEAATDAGPVPEPVRPRSAWPDQRPVKSLAVADDGPLELPPPPDRSAPPIVPWPGDRVVTTATEAPAFEQIDPTEPSPIEPSPIEQEQTAPRTQAEIPEGARLVTFSSLDGTTTVATEFVGELESVTLLDAEGGIIPLEEAGATVETGRAAIRIDIADAREVAGVVLAGEGGVVRLMVEADGPDIGRLGPRDGMIDIRDRRLEETIRVPREMTDVAAAPGAHGVSVNRQSTEIVAVRDGEIAVSAEGIRLPQGASVDLRVENPAGERLSAEAPAWGYRLLVQSVTNTNFWVPIRIRIIGLAPREKAVVRFVANETQSIEPLEVTLRGAQALQPLPIAEIRTSRIGAQDIEVTVERVP